MTLPGLATAGAASSAHSSDWRMELAETLKLAWPMAMTQLGQVAMMTSDLALIGRLGDHVVAAAALAHTILFSAFVLGMGLVSAVAPLAAQAFGARDPRMVRRALRVGLWAAAILGLPLTLAQLHGYDLLLVLGQDQDAAAIAARYLWGLAWSLIPAWWFIGLRSFMGAVNRPEPALWITLIAIPANAALAYVLIYGAFELPGMDVLGAGIATTLVNLAMCVAAIWICYAQPPFRKYRVLGRFWRADWPLFGKLLVIGAPISGTFALEYGLFAAAALLMGWLGTTALAAHQIALQTAAVMFMVPFGISMAATVRVGHAVGRRNAAAARSAGFIAIWLGAAFMLAMTLLVIGLRDTIPALFLGGATEASETAALAATLLLVGASFFIADGVQTIGAGSLRGLNDTRVPLVFSAVCFWAIGFTSSYGLGFPLGFGAIGVWIGFTIGLAAYALLLVWRFHLLTKQGYLPALAEPG
ncbi:MAG: MATE family efflux transporter [Pseudorhodoplanes sp.]|nr:Multidrug resistance protein NorM [Pseudorhodoplanes sp.]MBW7948631.1 MATE family efflux transporter [Pseudorhodoplanes sp.]MCL4711944.1 MATE family efflux transporter [Pseudorhodoplanes sp.]MCQ3943331.1 MATE family efflux transporter [Alphaproteobacteria bacterium]GIK83086.1 MAG: putative multidrug resistance protein NorM [Alphaproteobacteria bacterium]